MMINHPFISQAVMSKMSKRKTKPINFLVESEPHTEKEKQTARKVKVKHNINPSELILNDEQVAIIDAVKNGYSVVCEAGPGNSKSTVCLEGACIWQQQTLHLTYNAALKGEVRESIVKRNIEHIMEVHNYNSLACRYYNNRAYTNDVIQTIVDNNSPPIRAIPNFQIICIDELQDMTPFWYAFVLKFLKDLNNSNVKLLLLGDSKQSLYEYKGSDSRFLTLADKLWASESNKFKRLELTQSFRCPISVINLLNKCMIGNDRLISKKPGPNVSYIYESIWKAVDIVYKEISRLIRRSQATPDQFFILAYSTKTSKGTNSTPLTRLEQMLAQNDFPCYSQDDDQSTPDDKCYDNKIVFSSFHQCKGRQRPYVYVFGFDESFFVYFKKKAVREICPSELYVAVSRTQKKLTLIHNKQKNVLPFLKIDEMIKQGIITHDIFAAHKDINYTPKEITTSPTDLCKHLNDELLASLRPLLKPLISDHSMPETENVNINCLVEIKNRQFDSIIFEDISAIVGLTAQMCCQDKLKTLKQLLYHISTAEVNATEYKIKKAQNDVDADNPKLYMSTDKLLYIAGLYLALRDGYRSKFLSIKNWDLLNDEQIEGFTSNMLPHFESNFEYEKELEADYCFPDIGATKIRGHIDCFSPQKVIEIKCVSSLTIDHQLQLVVYMWLINRKSNNRSNAEFILLNVQTGQAHKIQNDPDTVHKIVNLLVQNKFGSKENVIDDQCFLEQCSLIKNRKIKVVSNQPKPKITTACPDSFVSFL